MISPIRATRRRRSGLTLVPMEMRAPREIGKSRLWLQVLVIVLVHAVTFLGAVAISYCGRKGGW